jgi:hypothetical protein
VKAVRFIMASNSQLKYGARLINSYLGDNSTISCCEVLNSLIFPAHEQHHNNSFLCAALVMGQSNMAAGATIGSNHNSRSPDGEIVAGRGFWPGLCVSLKHNSRFASFNILAKGDYPAELNIPIPFALISNDTSKDELLIMPAYWFQYNMYALARNSWKYVDRDKRTDKTQRIEYDFLAPDSIGEMLEALSLLCRFTGKAWVAAQGKKKKYADEELIAMGKELLEEGKEDIEALEIFADGFENSDRKIRLIKVPQAYRLFRELIAYHAGVQLLAFVKTNKITGHEALQKALPGSPALTRWRNVGGQLIRETEVDKLLQHIHQGKVKDWNDVHSFYTKQGEGYVMDKLHHALAALKDIGGPNLRRSGKAALRDLLQTSISTKEWMVEGIYASRAKDYTNPFRKMVYDSPEEMDTVIGALKDNGFIRQERQAAKAYRREIDRVIRQFEL